MTPVRQLSNVVDQVKGREHSKYPMQQLSMSLVLGKIDFESILSLHSTKIEHWMKSFEDRSAITLSEILKKPRHDVRQAMSSMAGCGIWDQMERLVRHQNKIAR